MARFGLGVFSLSMATKKPRWSWSGGLYYRLMRLGFDPANAKFVSRHIRRDILPFVEEWKKRVGEGEDPIIAFNFIFYGRGE